MIDDLVKRLRDKVEASRIYDDDEELLDEAAEEIELLRKRISVMEVEKSLADACLTSGYVRQTFETGTGDFSKFQGKKDE
jgi:hypothetical protein